MSSKLKQGEEHFQVKRYKIQYPISAYTFPREAKIHQVRFDDAHMLIELTDGRTLSVPLWWIPTVHNALPKDREKFEISRDHTMIIWDPDKCSINDGVRIADYLGAIGGANHFAAEGIMGRRQVRAPRERKVRRSSAKARG